MTNPLIDEGVFNYDPSKPFEIRITDANDLVMPATGTIVVPRAPTGNLDDDIGNIRGLNDHDWLFYSFLYPRAAQPGDETLLGYEMVFPALRSANNHPFGLGRDVNVDPFLSNPVAGNVLCLIEQDYSPLHDLHPGELFNNIGDVYSSRYKENITISSRAKVLIIHFDKNVNLPQTTPPISRDRGFKLITDSDDSVTEGLRNALEAVAVLPLSATVYAFDLAGHQIDGYSAILAYDESFQISLVTVPPAVDFDKKVLVQFVDIHGQPLHRDELPLNALEFSQIESFEPGIGPGDTANDALLYGFKWVDAQTPRIVGIQAKSNLSDIEDAEKYRYRHLQVGLWPGFGFDFKAIGSDTPVEFNLAKDWPNISTLPRFARFCVFHPGDEFQTKAGGELDEKGVFSTNKFKLFTDDNQVQVFNSGDMYFADLAREIGEPGEFETVKAIYINNWVSHAHLFLHGKMAGHGIAYNDEDKDVVSATLEELILPAQNIVVPLDPPTNPTTDEAKDYFVLMPQIEVLKEKVNSTFQVDLQAIVASTPTEQIERAHRGYVRAGSIHTWRLLGENGTPHEHRITASWKNSIGMVPTTTTTLPPIGAIPVTRQVPEELLELTINSEDPPKAVLKRKLSYDNLLCRLADKADGCPAQERFDDSSMDLQLIFLHLEDGSVEYIPLNPDPASQENNDLILHTFERLFATDLMAVAILDRKQDPNQQNFVVHLKTRFREIEYSNEAFINGNVPFTTEEWGGFLRQQITEGVIVKALYWENHLANLESNKSLARGLNNNAELTAVLNRVVNSMRGFAMRDRATRPLGAFHQKGIVVVKEVNDPFTLGKSNKVVAYIGGMDLAQSRWDREAHHHLDPERMAGNGWYDVQMRIEGSAAIDVLLNFKQRWEALNIFESEGIEECRPINAVPDMDKEIKVPKKLIEQEQPGHFLQVTRTISPDSCHSRLHTLGFPNQHFVNEDGDLGSLFTYLKAIKKARKYILINDQYLFSVEIANAIHEALLREDGPECAIICLPKNLNESELVDPMIYKIRRRAINALFFGATLVDQPPLPVETHPQRYNINAPDEGVSVKDKVVVLTPINRSGDEIYVHSKQFIVDDCIMSIGSANFSFRGCTYEMEINATAVGRKLVKGGTDLVREQRIEVCRRMLGLPKAYSSLLQDYYATFKIFKAIEMESAGDVPPTLNLHPLRPMVKQLDPDFVTRSGGAHAGFDDNVDFVIATDENSPGLMFVSRNVIDIDGRQRDDDTTAVLAANFASSALYLGEFPRNPVAAYGRVTFDLTLADSSIRQAIDNGQNVLLDVTMLSGMSGALTATPFRIANFAIIVDPITSQLVIKNLHNNALLVNISTDHIVTVRGHLLNQDEVALGFSGEHEFNPLTEPILPASFTPADIQLLATP